ncbi:TetR/AcrR family transcriptional regulator [Streptomyces albidoflavus]
MAGTRFTPEREGELYTAVLGLLREVGYDALTMDAVAARAHTSKATLYRQWGSKAELVVRALRCEKPVFLDEVDTGSLRGDLDAVLELTDDDRLEQDTALMRGLMQAASGNAELHDALVSQLITPETAGVDSLLHRAVDRGEVAADNPALGYVPHMIIGALAARLLIENRPVDRAFLRHYVHSVVFPALGV